MNGISHLTKTDEMEKYAASKKVPYPYYAVVLSGLMILIAGFGILLGVYIRWDVAFLAVFVIPVSLKMHDFWNAEDEQTKIFDWIQFTKNMALLGAALMLLAIPEPWAYSLEFLLLG